MRSYQQTQQQRKQQNQQYEQNFCFNMNGRRSRSPRSSNCFNRVNPLPLLFYALFLLTSFSTTTTTAQDVNCVLTRDANNNVESYVCHPVVNKNEGRVAILDENASPTNNASTTTDLLMLQYIGEPPYASNQLLQQCQGDCDSDWHCDYGLNCFKRSDHRSIPGCHLENEQHQQQSTQNATMVTSNTFYNTSSNDGNVYSVDYCYRPPPGTLVIVQNASSSSITQSGRCQGTCRSNADCQANLVCKIRGNYESVPGCIGLGAHATNYCYDPQDSGSDTNITTDNALPPPAPSSPVQETFFPTRNQPLVPPPSPTAVTLFPTRKSPTTTAPITIAPATSAPMTVAPITKAPFMITESPITNAPTTAATVTREPATRTPVTKAPTTSSPATREPSTRAPVTKAPATNAPATREPATRDPITKAPTTAAPATRKPATRTPVTKVPSTNAPATRKPATRTPVTKSPTTALPTFVSFLPEGSNPTIDRSVPTAAPSIIGAETLPSRAPKLPPTKNPTTVTPVAVPSLNPNTVAPTKVPTNVPSAFPMDFPSSFPSREPSRAPSDFPSVVASSAPTTMPSSVPSDVPSTTPTGLPSDVPSIMASDMPSVAPSKLPTESPSSIPSAHASDAPSSQPSVAKSNAPSGSPSKISSSTPSIISALSPPGFPTNAGQLSNEPTTTEARNETSVDDDKQESSSFPTSVPSMSSVPSSAPSDSPVAQPSVIPSKSPSSGPSIRPSTPPSNVMSNVPSNSPTELPSELPSIFSSSSPTLLCGTPTLDRQSNIASELMALSSNFNSSQAQEKALEWLINQDLFQLCPGDLSSLVQRFALAVFWYSCGGEYWLPCLRTNQTNVTIPGGCLDDSPFLSSTHECRWRGVQCDLHLAVTALHLDDRNVTCKGLPSEISYLEFLQEIDMDSNNISGTIPSWIGSLKRLEIVDLDSNQLSGSIPESFYNANALRVIDLDHNALTGTLSSDISNLSDLYFLQLDFNRFIGGLPTVIGQLTNLEYLSILGNNFTKPIPTNLCRQKNNISDGVIIYANCDICTIENCCTACLELDFR